MILPFASEKKVKWNLAEYAGLIDRAIAETDLREFERHLRLLYPKIERYGIRLPLLEPVWYAEAPEVWYDTHLRGLKRLAQMISHDVFDLQHWNRTIHGINEDLCQSVERMAQSKDDGG